MDKPISLIQVSFKPVCSPNTCKSVFNPNVTFQLSQIVGRVCTLVLFIIIIFIIETSGIM